MTLDEFIKKYQGQAIGYNGYVGECLSLVKQYIKEVFGIEPPPSGTNSAYGYWSNFPNPLPTIFDKVDSGIPQKGDIVIWKPTAGNPYGHIAIFIEGDDKSVRSFDQNWGGKQAHIQNHSYASVVGWLHPKGGEMTNDEVKLLIYKATQGHEPQGDERAFALGPIKPDELADLRFKDDVVGSLWTATLNSDCPQSEKDFWKQYAIEHDGNTPQIIAKTWYKDHVQKTIDDAVSQTQQDFQQYKDGEAERTETAVKKAVSDTQEQYYSVIKDKEDSLNELQALKDAEIKNLNAKIDELTSKLNGLTQRVTIESIVWNYIKKLFKK